MTRINREWDIEDVSDKSKALLEELLDATRNVRKAFGPGLEKEVYKKCLLIELNNRGYKVESNVEVPIYYNEIVLADCLKMDTLIEDCLIVRVISDIEITPEHRVELCSWINHSRKPIGVIINFSSLNFKEGICIIFG